MAPSKKPVAKKPALHIVPAEPEGNDGRVIDETRVSVETATRAFDENTALDEEAASKSAEVDIEELPGGGTRETPRPSRRYSR